MGKSRQGGPPRLVLASGSPRRRELLARLGLDFDLAAASEVDEVAALGSRRTEPAAALVRRLAVMKAEEVLRRLAGAGAGSGHQPQTLLVLGADTLVSLADLARAGGRPRRGPAERLLGKPRDLDEAREMLASLSGRRHRVYTGLALARPGQPTRAWVEETTVEFRRLTSAQIEAYLASGEPLDKAGAYAIQGKGGGLVAGFEGCFYNIVGLPLVRTASILGQASCRRCPFACDCADHPLQRGRAGCTELAGASPP